VLKLLARSGDAAPSDVPTLSAGVRLLEAAIDATGGEMPQEWCVRACACAREVLCCVLAHTCPRSVVCA
jgi:hypothetical protein